VTASVQAQIDDLTEKRELLGHWKKDEPADKAEGP
jgi:hypothetical protein